MNDTHPEVDAKHFALLREAGGDRRLTMALALSESVISMSRMALRELHPEDSEQGILLRWSELHYDVELTDRVRAPRSRYPSLIRSTSAPSACSF